MQADSKRFSQPVQALLQDPENQLFLSAASSWEIAIKYALGKLPLPLPPMEYVLSRMATSGTSPLPISTVIRYTPAASRFIMQTPSTGFSSHKPYWRV